MVASNKTLLAVYDVLQRHVRQRDLDNIIRELMRVPGNASFRETVEALHAMRQADKARSKSDESSKC